MKKFCIISHTHWDREWYIPLEQFRLRLVDLIDKCLLILEKYPGYIFHLDAQTIILEDYLKIRPYKRDLLKKYVSEGNLVIGPWYLQNDFYLTSGEATVRNLLEGIRTANEFGACSKAGYTPDQFGIISQLPQILKNFGIDTVIFGRGANKHVKENGEIKRLPLPSEFTWRGADSTDALAIHMKYWYNNAQRFSEDTERAAGLLDLIERQFEGVALTPYLLCMNGVDHLEAQDNLLPIIDALAKKGHDVAQYNIDEYIKSVRSYIQDNKLELIVREGELRHGGDYEILHGTLSSRVYLKQANVTAQNNLECKLEMCLD
jgi:alpha-mannosidase